MSNEPLHVVLGATGGIGKCLVDELDQTGHRVRAVSASGGAVGSARVEVVAADLEDAHAAMASIDGATVVYMSAMPPYYDWPKRFAPMIHNVIVGAEAAGAKLVMVDNFYMYGPDVEDIHEDSPQNPRGHKGKTRKAVADQLLAAHAAGRVVVTIGRLSDYYGPGGDNSAVAVTVLGPAAEGKTIRWSGHPSLPHTLHYLPDVARAFVVLGESDQANGDVWILPAAEALTGTQLVDLVNELADKPVKWSRPPKGFFTVAGLFSKMMRELKETTYQFDQRYVSHADKFLKTFGPFEVTPHAEAIKATFDSVRSDTRVAPANA